MIYWLYLFLEPNKNERLLIEEIRHPSNNKQTCRKRQRSGFQQNPNWEYEANKRMQSSKERKEGSHLNSDRAAAVTKRNHLGPKRVDNAARECENSCKKKGASILDLPSEIDL